MGAPRKFPPKNAAALIEELASQGNSIIGIAKKLGVGRELFKRWREEDDALQEAFEIGRDTHRQTLVTLIMRDAVAGKNANGNCMFLLKTMHGYREQDSTSTKVNVGVGITPSVMIVRDHGDDDQWAARIAEQQRTLVLDAASPPKGIEASVAAPPPHVSAVEATQAHATYNDVPAWRGNA
jgi:hypothetical protein